MVIDVIAIYDDGSRPADPSLPADPRVAIALAIGDAAKVRVRLVTRSGVRVKLASGDRLVLTARTPANPQQKQIFQKTIAGPVVSTGAFNVYSFAIASTDLARLGSIRRLVFDIVLVTGGASYTVLRASTLSLGGGSVVS